MTGSLSRKCYQRILSLYPEPFRREFGEEMLSVFDECLRDEKAACLLADGLRAAIRQQAHYFATPAPEHSALYSEVGSSPSLARSLAMSVVAAGLFLSIFVRGEKPQVYQLPVKIEHRIWYSPCAEVAVTAKLPRSKRHADE